MKLSGLKNKTKDHDDLGDEMCGKTIFSYRTSPKLPFDAMQADLMQKGVFRKVVMGDLYNLHYPCSQTEDKNPWDDDTTSISDMAIRGGKRKAWAIGPGGSRYIHLFHRRSNSELGKNA